MAANHGTPSLQSAMEDIRSLQRKVTTMEKEQAEQNADFEDESLIESQPLRQSLWDSKVPENFKSPHLPTFDGKTDHVEHLMPVGTQTVIIGAPEHLRCKLLSGTLKDAALRWYMNLPNNSIESYADFHKRFIHQFSGTKHIKVTATSLFTIRHNYAETLRECLTRFSEAISNPNQEMLVAAFHNGLKAGYFKESLAQKPATTMQEVVERGQNSQPQLNWKNIDTHKQGYRAKPYYPPNVGGGMGYPQHRRPSTFASPRMKNTVMGPNTEAWRAYHRCKGHDTERCFRLRDLIEDLIRSRHLRKFLEDAAKGQVALPKQIPYQQKGEGDGGSKGEKHWVAVNTIFGGFTGGGESSSARKRYVRRSRFEICLLGKLTFPHVPEISFNPEDGRNVIPHDDDRSSADMLYRDAYKAMRLSDEQLNPYFGMLVGFVGEQVDVMGHITLYTTFGEEENAKTIKVRYLMVKTPFTSYNIIIGRPTFNILGAVMSTLYLSIKYPLNNGKIEVVKGNQALARKCYESSLKIRHKPSRPVSPPDSGERINGINMVSITDLDHREEFQDRRVSPIEDLEQVQIGEQPHQTTNIGTSLHPEEKERIIAILRNNRDLFAWQPSDMPGIDESVITHKLSISPANKPVVQRKRKVGEERRAAITEEVAKLKEAGFIEEIKYPTWLANVVMVKKANGKWRMWVDFTDLNKAYSKDLYPLSNINRLIDGASGATYQRLIDRVFVEQIGKNLEVYIDDMVVKTEKEGIEAIPNKFQAIINMRSPTLVKEVQQLTGRITALSRFLSCSCEKACHFFATLRKSESFTWSLECEEAFQKLKVFLASPPILTRPEQGKTLYLYLAVSEKALSSALVQEIEGEEKPIYFVIIARKVIFNSSNNSSEAAKILSEPPGGSKDRLPHQKRAIKSQALADFVLELTDPPSENEAHPWTFSMDGSSNLRGSGSGVVLEGPEGVIIEQSLRFAFKASNNQAEYEALIAGMKLAKEMEVQECKVQSDSQLVANQVAEEFQTKDP
ncbi:hypothetical protein TSUD_368080 [Trifolium subterraneum]|uniref:RNase H type-1 domain-containing protein n=1 Tax=Trifolium subterraneum TaxID=3900 RepID=A0A2Z6M4F9_TRISU|nr:hypothetical protein TSUD_368080 [Trifolium subterraneum]